MKITKTRMLMKWFEEGSIENVYCIWDNEGNKYEAIGRNPKEARNNLLNGRYVLIWSARLGKKVAF